VDRLDAEPALAQVLRRIRREPGSIRSRRLYFSAEHERHQGNVAHQTELLDKAIASDATDADVLIALYRLPNPTDVRRQQTVRQIKAAADAFHREIQEKPESPSGYNQLAWLLGNTLGETDKTLAEEAVHASLKSLELQPGAAGYIDTLARCYYAKGDYEAAVRHETEALRLDPHSGLIRRQLEEFQKALAAARKKTATNPTPKS
jgi:tetratricopeptide (TPR) repeat protein